MLVAFLIYYGFWLILLCWHVGPDVLACWSWCVGMLVLVCWFVDPGFVHFDEECLNLWVP